MSNEEHVLVIPTAWFHELGHFQGFSEDRERYLGKLFAPEQTSYRPRSAMEEDPSFKQLIPYVIFRHTDDAGVVSLFQYTRGSGQGEARLHAKRSVGVGGHISAEDSNQSNAYEEGMRRELEEEVNINTTYEANCVGLINDDESEVGKVHLGVVHIFDVATTDVTAREDDIANATFTPLKELLNDIDSFETWSQITLRALFA